MNISLDLNVNPKQADDIAAELIAYLIGSGYEILDYEVST